MRNAIKQLLITTVIFIAVFLSCETNPEVQDFKSVESTLLETKMDLVSKLNSSLEFGTTVNLRDLSNNFKEGQTYKELSYENLHSTILGYKNDNFSIDAISVYYSQNIIRGIGVYTYFMETNTLKFYLLKYSNNVLEIVDGFPKNTNNIVNKDVLYVSNKYFNYINTSLIFSPSKIEYENLNTDYNDLGTERVINAFLSAKEKDLYKKNITDNFLDDGFDDGFDDGNGCGFTRTCKSGSSNYSCIPSGCVKICQRAAIARSMNETDFANQKNLNIDLLLPVDKLYSIKNLLEGSLIGRRYRDIYYQINNHFYESLNTSIIIDLFTISTKVNSIIDKINDSQYSGVIINESIYEDLSILLNKSKNNSHSLEYKQAISLLINDLAEFTNLDKNTFMNKLEL